MLEKVRGCIEKCPCCRRPCDVDHTLMKSIPGSSGNQHRCNLGHALRAMNGYRYEITEEASLLMCEHLQAQQIIVVGPVRQRWSDFKKDHHDWNFDSNLTVDQFNRLHGKFLGVWAKIGSELCEKDAMKFVTMNALKPVEPFSLHYILLLDGSGSMRNRASNDLLNGVNEFLKYRSVKNSADRITILVFSTVTKTEYFNKTISEIKLSRINFPGGGGTDFTDAFATVHRIIKRAEEQTPNSISSSTGNAKTDYAIIFMSDGQADYPHDELTALLISYKSQIKRFWTVALGLRKMDILEKINNTMIGLLLNIKDSSELFKTYAEIARTDIT